tara:strand:- start:215 stop:814 length:600 start_codon:yes stop_codon:yes gene_type:complete
MKKITFLVLGLLLFSCKNEKKLSKNGNQNLEAFEKQKHKRSLEISEDCLTLKNILKNRETAVGKEISLHGAFSTQKSIQIYDDNTIFIHFKISTMPYFACNDYNDFGAQLYTTQKIKIGNEKLNIHVTIIPSIKKSYAPNTVEVDLRNLVIYDDNGNEIRNNEYVKAVFKIIVDKDSNKQDLKLQLLSIEQQPETLYDY